MTEPTAIIADDEPLLRREIRELLADLWPELEIVGEFGDGAAALFAIEHDRPAVCFLDVRMPKLTGLEVAERVQGTTQVVFVTAYDEHAIAAFEHGVADYIVKPIKAPRLAATVQRLKNSMAQMAGPGTASSRPVIHWIQASLGNTLRFVAAKDVCYFRSDGKYTRVVTADFEALIRKPLAELLGVLDPDLFRRINRGIVVNLRHVESVARENSGSMTVHIRRGLADLPVSKPHQAQFRGM